MKIKIAVFVMLASQFSLSSFEAQAQSKRNNLQDSSYTKQNMVDAKGKAITVVNFDDAYIEGQARSPDGFVLQSKTPGSFKSILELRRNFRPQINADGTSWAAAVP